MRLNSVSVCDTNVLINIDLHKVFRPLNKINTSINMIKYDKLYSMIHVTHKNKFTPIYLSTKIV